MVKDLASNRTKVEVAVGGIVTTLLGILGASLASGNFEIVGIIVPLIFGFILTWFGIQLLAVGEYMIIKSDGRKDVISQTTALVARLELKKEDEPTWK
jgi:uncharacterized protein YacL